MSTLLMGLELGPRCHEGLVWKRLVFPRLLKVSMTSGFEI